MCRLVGSLDLLDATYAGPDMVTDCSKIYQAEVRPCTPSQRRRAATPLVPADARAASARPVALHATTADAAG